MKVKSNDRKIIQRISVHSILMVLLVGAILLTAVTKESFGQYPAQQTVEPAQSAQESAEELQQLVAPIALYPDNLIAQILAASTYPTQIVEADRWLQQNSGLKGERLAVEVDKMAWDPSVKALTQFPSVLENMDKNLSWTSALGEAYYNNSQGVLDTIQVMRRQAESAGNLKSTPQENVIDQGSNIVIEPANPDIVYVPTYNPTLVYGEPIALYPDYIYGGWYDSPFISYGLGFGIGPYWGGFGWGWPFWGFNWGSRAIVFNRRPFIAHNPAFNHFVGVHGNFRSDHFGPVVRANHNFGGFPNHNFDHGHNVTFPNSGFRAEHHESHGFGSGPGFRGGMHGSFGGGMRGGFGGGMHGGGGRHR